MFNQIELNITKKGRIVMYTHHNKKPERHARQATPFKPLLTIMSLVAMLLTSSCHTTVPANTALPPQKNSNAIEIPFTLPNAVLADPRKPIDLQNLSLEEIKNLPLPEINIVHYQKPDVYITLTPFEEAGCEITPYQSLQCPEEFIETLGCGSLQLADPLLGGLEPSLPITKCWYKDPEHTKGGIYRSGGLYDAVAGGYVIFLQGRFQLVISVPDFQSVYLPIESSPEALAYALALTELSAYYNLDVQPGYLYFVDTLEDTHVIQVDDGYVMNLYGYHFFGCGPHETDMYNVYVNSTTGGVEIRSKQTVFTNLLTSGLCVD